MKRKQFLKIWLVYVNIINIKELILTFLILRHSRKNEVRLQNLYLALCKHSLNVQSPHKWWSTLKSAVFGSSSSLPPLVSEDGGLVCESVGKADLLSDHFDSKQSREAVESSLGPKIIHLSI